MSPAFSKEKYAFRHYLSLERWSSFHYQLRLIIECAPRLVLEVGMGSGVVGDYLRNHTDIKYQSLDLEPDLKPDLVGSVTKIPAANDSFDLIAVFEVLEHLPFEEFEVALSELYRVARRFVVISLPDSRPHLRLSLKIPFLPRFQASVKIPFPRKHRLTGEHWWEVGKRGFSNQKILSLMRRHFKVLKHFVPYENQYHHFYLLEKK